MSNYDLLSYWIQERYNVFLKKEAGEPKPWSSDRIFQTVYFCNVHRENDRVTRWIRDAFSDDPVNPEFNMLVARFVNKPSSLEKMGWPFVTWKPLAFEAVMSQPGSWGGAYIVSTNGNPVPKHEYISGLLSAAWEHFEQQPLPLGTPNLNAAYTAIQAVSGVASFMAGQILADLKNTEGHPLQRADDWWTWCAHGPGSLRGMAWVLDMPSLPRMSPSLFYRAMPELRKQIDKDVRLEHIPKFCNQDLQNCLCEFDKFMRVQSGTGRSKRKYNGN